MKTLILCLILSLPINTLAQKYSKSDQLVSANHWLDYYFKSNYSNLQLDPYSHKISITTTLNGFKQYVDNIYLDITDNGSSWNGMINLKKAVWKSYEDYSSEDKSMTFNSNGFMTSYAIISYDETGTAFKYEGNNYSDKQIYGSKRVFEGTTQLEEPYYMLIKTSNFTSNKKYYIEYNYNEKTYKIADDKGIPVQELALVDRQPNGNFDYSLFGVREVGTYKKGLFDGNYTKYNKEGIRISEGRYKNGDKVGEWKEFSDDFELYDMIDDVCYDYELDFIDILDNENHFNKFSYDNEEYIIGQVEMTYATGENLGYYNFSEDDDVVYGNFELFYKNGKTFAKGKYNRNGELKSLSIFKSTGTAIKIDESKYLDD
tara:strand:+ start:73880 stop:74998 length:1119 start_codon:yes stop_codon:yes gene_type:complete